jgi:hypothetical protein
MKNKAKEMLQKGMAGEEVEKEDDTEEEDSYEMPRSEAIEEHVRLIEVLRSGNKMVQLAEAKLQEKELRKIKNEK